MSDHYELNHYKFDKVDHFLRCTYTGGQRPHNVDSVEYIRSNMYSDWYNAKTWERLLPRSDRRCSIEKALLQRRYNEALEKAKQSDNPPLPVPMQLSDSVQEVIRNAVIASNVETYKTLTDTVDAFVKETTESFGKVTVSSAELGETLVAKMLDLQGVVDLIKEVTMDLQRRVTVLEQTTRSIRTIIQAGKSENMPKGIEAD